MEMTIYSEEWREKYPIKWSTYPDDYSHIYFDSTNARKGRIDRKIDVFSDWFRGKLSGRTLTDIGAYGAEEADYRIAARCGCPHVVRIDPRFHDFSIGKVSEVPVLTEMVMEADGLTYLREQNDDSSVVMANGLFNEPFQPAFWRDHPYRADDKWVNYVKDLIQEIYRVTPNIFFGNGMNPVAREWCVNAGFKELDPFSPKNSIHADPSRFDGIDFKLINMFLFEKKIR